VARHVGARHVVITDMNPGRLALAAEVADVVPVDIASQDLREVMGRLGMREGFDVGLEMSGAPAALDQMIDHMVMGGRIALLGIPARPFPFDLAKIVFRMITLKGIYGREMFETWHKMLAMLESGLDVRKVISARCTVENYAEAFERAASGEPGKIVLDWQAFRRADRPGMGVPPAGP
jgi:threonine 3-dehydrogenase